MKRRGGLPYYGGQPPPPYNLFQVYSTFVKFVKSYFPHLALAARGIDSMGYNDWSCSGQHHRVQRDSSYLGL